MSGYVEYGYDPDYELWQRERHRKRLLSGIRGWLREKSFPRWKMAGVLAACAIPGIGAAWLATFCGASQYGLAEAVGVLAAWPFCLLSLRQLARTESRRLNFEADWTYFIYADEAAHAQENRPLTPEEQKRRDDIQRGIDAGLRAGNQGSEGGAVIVLLLFGLLTVGVWLVWSLIRCSTAILAEIVLDGELIPAHPEVFRRVPSGAWYKEAAATTGIHFFGLAASMMLLVYLVSFLPLLDHRGGMPRQGVNLPAYFKLPPSLLFRSPCPVINCAHAMH